ncbi:RCC1 domain protein [Ceratobasidium sp. AG-Ba]|nr:RCC1 domain protein [Ceratobasidium sp. AG-Ba]
MSSSTLFAVSDGIAPHIGRTLFSKSLLTAASKPGLCLDTLCLVLVPTTLSILALCSARIAHDASVPRLFLSSRPPLPALHAPPEPRADDAPPGRPAFPPRPAFAHAHSQPAYTHSPAPRPVPVDDRADTASAPPHAGAYLPSPATTEPMPHLAYPYDQPEQPYGSRAASATPAYAPDDRRVSTSSAGSYEHAYPYPYPRQPYPQRATSPMIARGSIPYEYPLDPTWAGRRPSAEQSPVPSARPYDDQYHPDDSVPALAQSQLAYPIPLDHQSPMQSLGSSSSNSTGLPASPDLALQPTGLVAPLSEGPNPPSSQNPGHRTYAFVSLQGSTIRKRPRRRYDEIERLYSCSFEDCTKAYGTLNHLNAHVTMQKHGAKRNPSEFKELRKMWRSQKKAEQSGGSRHRRRRLDDDDPQALRRTASGSYSTDPESDDGTPQPGEYGQVDQMWSHGMVPSGGVAAQGMGEMRARYDDGSMGYHPDHDPHGHGMGAHHLIRPDPATPIDRIPANAMLLQDLPPSHPSQQPQQFSSPHPHPMAGYGGMPMSGNPPVNMRRASDHGYDYERPGPYR